MSYKTEHRTKKTETMLKRKNGSNTERENVSNPQQHALFGNSHSGIFQAQTSLETLKDPQRDFGPGIFHCVSSKTVHAVMSLFHRNPQLFSAGGFDEKATVFDEKSGGFR